MMIVNARCADCEQELMEFEINDEALKQTKAPLQYISRRIVGSLHQKKLAEIQGAVATVLSMLMLFLSLGGVIA